MGLVKRLQKQIDKFALTEQDLSLNTICCKSGS